MHNIFVQTTDESASLHGGTEVWVQVTGMEPLPDWPTVRTEVQHLRPDLNVPNLPKQFIPGSRLTADDGTILHRFEDWWIFPLEEAW